MKIQVRPSVRARTFLSAARLEKWDAPPCSQPALPIGSCGGRKCPPSVTAGQQGSVLLICLMAAAIIGISLASYLSLSQQEYVTVCRSQTWNRTMPVAEAGAEEALALLNTYAGTSTNITAWTNAAAFDGWTALNNNVYSVKRYFGKDYYQVYITNANNAPVIKSTATLAWNYLYAAAPQTLFAAAGVTTTPVANPTRAVLLKTAAPQNYFLYGILANKGISLSGGSTFDSVNSLDTNYAANPWSKSLGHAKGSIGTLAGAFGESSSTIYGHVYTGPASTISVSGGNGGIGDTNWVPSHQGQIEPGWTNNTLNVSLPDPPTAPAGLATYLPLPTPVHNNYILTGSGNPGTPAYYYVDAGTTISGGAVLLVTNGAVVLKCKGDFTLSGGSGISIAKGSTLAAYLNGTTSLGGGGVVNNTYSSTNCIFYGSPTCTNITYGGGSGFIGIVYAPEAAYILSGQSGFIGAVIANSFSQTGGALLRYDEALANAGGPGSIYRVVSWQEVPP